MGDGGELERTQDDVYGTGVTVRSCCEKRFEKKTLKTSLKFSMDSRRDQSLLLSMNSPTVAKVFENKFGQVVEKPGNSFPKHVERTPKIRLNL